MLPPVCAVTNLAGQNNQCYVEGVRDFVYFVYGRLWHLADIKEILKAQHCFNLPVYINAAAKTPKRALIIRETTVMEPPPAARSLPHRSPAEKTGRTDPPHRTFPARSGTPLHRRRVLPWPAVRWWFPRQACVRARDAPAPCCPIGGTVGCRPAQGRSRSGAADCRAAPNRVRPRARSGRD